MAFLHDFFKITHKLLDEGLPVRTLSPIILLELKYYFESYYNKGIWVITSKTLTEKVNDEILPE